jgi:hypothetical protein
MGIFDSFRTVVTNMLWGREKDMISMLWCQQILLGKKTFAQVPKLLKDKVRELLIDSGCPELAEE